MAIHGQSFARLRHATGMSVRATHSCEQVGLGSEDAKLRFAFLAHANRLVSAQRTRNIHLSPRHPWDCPAWPSMASRSRDCDMPPACRFALHTHANKSVSAQRTRNFVSLTSELSIYSIPLNVSIGSSLEALYAG